MRQARLAQSVERQALNLMVVGSSPTVGVLNFLTKFFKVGFTLVCDFIINSDAQVQCVLLNIGTRFE